MSFCRECGSEHKGDAKFCAQCGEPKRFTQINDEGLLKANSEIETGSGSVVNPLKQNNSKFALSPMSKSKQVIVGGVSIIIFAILITMLFLSNNGGGTGGNNGGGTGGNQKTWEAYTACMTGRILSGQNEIYADFYCKKLKPD